LEIRARADAVVVSAATADADRMTLGLPSPALRAERKARGQAPYPLRVLVTGSGRVDPALPLFTRRFSPIVIFSTHRMPAALQKKLSPQADLRLAEADSVDLHDVIRVLGCEYGAQRIHCEGGGKLFHSLLAADLVDEIYLTFCPLLFGGIKAPTLSGEPGPFLPHSVQFQMKAMETVGAECFLRYERAKA
jgi:riboflavin biosynthesis pyrimidine reductase